MNTLHFVALIIVSAVLGTITASIMRKRIDRGVAESFRREAEHAETLKRRARDHQLNHGRMIYNWLVKELARFEKYNEHQGVVVRKIEDNGGKFSILIERLWDGNLHGHLLQLDYDFVGRQEPYLGHIHYGAYGADILFWVDSHSPKACLDRLVIREVEQVVERDQTLV